MIKNLFNDYQRNLLIYNAWIELLEDMTEVNRSAISDMTSLLSFYEMSDEFLYNYLKFYGYDIAQENIDLNDINRNAISRYRFLIQNRGTKSSLESIFKTNGQLYSDKDIKVEIFFDGVPLYYNDNIRYTEQGFIEYTNIEDNNNDPIVVQETNDQDAVITVILQDADVNEESDLIQSVKPAGHKFNIFSQTGFSWVYDYGVYSIEEEFRGKYEKEPKYRQSAFINVENEEGTEIIDRKPYYNAIEGENGAFSDRDDKWYGLGEKDKRKASWTVYDDSNVNIHYFAENKLSPRPFIDGLAFTTNNLPEGWDSSSNLVKPEGVNTIASYPTINSGDSGSLNIWNNTDTADIDTSNDLLKGDFILPVKMGNVREFYTQSTNEYYDQNSEILGDISLILNTDKNNFGSTGTTQYPDVILNCNSNGIFHNITRYDSGENNTVQYTNKSRRFTLEKWKNYCFGAYRAYDEIYYVQIRVPTNSYVIIDDLEEQQKSKYNEDEEFILKLGKGGYLSKEFSYLNDDINVYSLNDEWNDYLSDEKKVVTKSNIEEEFNKGFCRVEDFVSSSWIDNLREYEVQLYHRVVPDFLINQYSAFMTLYESGEDAASLMYDQTLKSDSGITIEEKIYRMSFGKVKGTYFSFNDEKDLETFFGTYTGFYKVDNDKNIILEACGIVPSVNYKDYTNQEINYLLYTDHLITPNDIYTDKNPPVVQNIVAVYEKTVYDVISAGEALENEPVLNEMVDGEYYISNDYLDSTISVGLNENNSIIYNIIV